MGFKVDGKTEWKCAKCGEVKPLDEFCWQSKTKGLKHRECKVCQAIRRRKTGEQTKYYSTLKGKLTRKNCQYKMKYGITLDEADEMYDNQRGVCICGNALHHKPSDIFNKPKNRGYETVLDHCHDTGKPRFVVHHNCNVTLGYAEAFRRAGIDPVDAFTHIALASMKHV